VKKNLVIKKLIGLGKNPRRRSKKEPTWQQIENAAAKTPTKPENYCLSERPKEARSQLPDAIKVAAHSRCAPGLCSFSCSCGELASVNATKKSEQNANPNASARLHFRRDSIGAN
jgi:hypothetical protein